jgi:hypothetical protein
MRTSRICVLVLGNVPSCPPTAVKASLGIEPLGGSHMVLPKGMVHSHLKDHYG